ncbi:MAG TPA: TRAP transporter substrate-binding protein DctP [Polyangia bacterium]|nr:TRAP transporter substrate-binding protein DctP [Polyangia bacterium]
MLALVSLAIAATASAEPTHVLRFATVAPDGTEWARLSRSFAREIEEQTNGDVQIKWYFGGIAGNEAEMIARMRRGQLDGVASAGMLCQRLAPTMRAVHVVGLFQSRDEALYVLGRLKPRIDREFAAAGLTNLGEAGFGTDILFSRTPLRSLEELRQQRLWIWDLDEIYKLEMPALAIKATPLPLEGALAAFEAAQLDGFIGIPSAALVFQWSTRARYYSDLRVGYVMGCLVVSNSAFDPLPFEAQQAVHAASGRLMRQMEDIGERQDDALLNSLFEKQGMHRVEVSKSFRTEFLDAARAARFKLGSSLTTQALLDEINGWLADYRSDRR